MWLRRRTTATVVRSLRRDRLCLYKMHWALAILVAVDSEAGTRLSPEPPHEDKDPHDQQHEQHNVAPSRSLSVGHVHHALKRAAEDIRRGFKGVILV